MEIQEELVGFRDNDVMGDRLSVDLVYDSVKLQTFSAELPVSDEEKERRTGRKVLRYWLDTRAKQGKLEGIIDEARRRAQ